MINTKTLFVIACIPSLAILMSCNDVGSGGHTGHDDHEENSARDEHDDHRGHDEHEEHGEEVIKLSEAQLNAAEVKIEPLAGGEVASEIVLPAEVGLNQDTVLHVTPRVSGIVIEVHGFLGHDVQAGDLLAVIESPELGETKIAYLQAVQRMVMAQASYDRQLIISTNTAQLLDLLRTNPAPETLQEQTDSLRIGENKGQLLSSYVRMKAGEANYARVLHLSDQGISTQADLLKAQEISLSTQANYLSVFEEIDFSYRLHLQEATQEVTLAESGAENAQRRLLLLGFTQTQVQSFAAEPGMNIARYELRASSSGRIVSKHITPGENLDTNASVYTIADTNTVWLNISVYMQHAQSIKHGQNVTVWADGRSVSGEIDYVGSMISESTRAVPARVVLGNADGEWMPGMFVTARVQTDSAYAQRVVPAGALQTYEGHTVVFVQGEDGIEPIRVEVGRKYSQQAELLSSNIPLGTPIVVANSFLMKAELGKSSAGHQH